MSRIPLAEVDMDREEVSRVVDVLHSGQLADGPVVRRFEEEFATYCGVDRGVATSNGTTALHAALEALDIGDGDQVVTTPFSFIATANAVRLAGATPVFADIDPETFALDPGATEDAIQSVDGDVDAILVVHLYGLPADMEAFEMLADRYDAALIEDAAQAHGARYHDDRVGSFGDVACFSFYPTKNMTTGEGGMIVTDWDDVADRAAEFVNHGRSDADTHGAVGHNYRLSSIAAAIGREQLERLPEYVRARQANADGLTAALEDIPGVTPPVEPPDRRHAYNQYTIRCADRDRLRALLDDQGIESGVYYPTPIHQQPAYDQFDVEAPVAERAAGEVLSLPVHPGLSQGDVDSVAQAVREAVNVGLEVAD